MELALIRTLMDKEFYDNNKGIRTPDELLTKDVRIIKRTPVSYTHLTLPTKRIV